MANSEIMNLNTEVEIPIIKIMIDLIFDEGNINIRMILIE